MSRNLIIITLVLFGALTMAAFWFDGLAGFGEAITYSYASLQIFIDLVLTSVLAIVWMWHDSKKIDRNPWPWIVGTLLFGVFAPLIYLLTRRPALWS